ncbi:unnamed protein product [Owenia fusiformis]|uniref:Uncharacterized protein n=1 Tax=Owenia fusiformis TaxID=6347 RepID=A0A8J1TEE1_OWEFU|nr:unnamed protein product [Owenia fusiformis]
MQSRTVISLAVVLLGVFQKGTATEKNEVLEAVLKRILEDMLDDQIQVKEIDASSIKDTAAMTLTKCFRATTLSSLGKKFNILDDDNSDSITLEEFQEGLNDFRCQISQSEARQLFNSLDINEDHKLNSNEFIRAFQKPLSYTKKETLVKAFNKADSNQDGVLNLRDDLISEVFLENMDEDGNGEANIQEFADYYKIYQGISDAYFEYALKNVWTFE